MSEQVKCNCAWNPDSHAETCPVYMQQSIEALRVALLEIASVNPSERGIEWAKSYASDGLKGAGSELYARWLDTFKEAEALRGLTPELPPRPPEGAGLPRYGLRWNGPAQPLSVPMDDGYWTPWHLAEALRAEIEEMDALLNRQADLLRQTAIALRGPEPDLTRYSHSDIPTRATTAVAELDALRAENAALRESSLDVRALAASLYQACGAYDMPERILDALSAAANSEPFTHMIDGLLPCVPPSGEGVQSLVEALEACAASLAWNCFGECRAVHAGPIMPAAMALDTARAALAAHRQAQSQA